MEDLEAIGGAMYCLPCRTCPHGRTWIESWAPACPACILAAHTTITPEGPRVKDLDTYLGDVARCRVDTMAHTFEEWERIGDRATYGDGLGIEIDQPFHFMIFRG